MGTIDDILARRSIRSYTAEPVPEEKITLILKAAMSAPSAGNEQPWHYIVINERELLDSIPSFHPHASMVTKAPAAILVCGDLDRDLRQGYWVQDCAAATQNILIAAQALGLGAVWLGIYPREDRVKGLKGLFRLPEKVIPFALIPIGWPAEHKPPSERYDSERVHHNRWK